MYLEKLKTICTPVELQEISSGVNEELEDAVLVIDEIPDELVAVSERYEVGRSRDLSIQFWSPSSPFLTLMRFLAL